MLPPSSRHLLTMAKNNQSQSTASTQNAPSSGTTGFFQETPKVPNSFYEDESYKRIFSCELVSLLYMLDIANASSLPPTIPAAIRFPGPISFRRPRTRASAPGLHSRRRAQYSLRTDLGHLRTPRRQARHYGRMARAFSYRYSGGYSRDPLRE